MRNFKDQERDADIVERNKCREYIKQLSVNRNPSTLVRELEDLRKRLATLEYRFKLLEGSMKPKGRKPLLP